MTPILKLFAFPVSFMMICLGVFTIFGGHITPGGGFQGGSMIAGGIILCILVYGIEGSPIKFSHDSIAMIESIGSLGFVLFGLIGFFVSGFYLYNIGTDFYNILPQSIVNICKYPDPTNAGFIPYLNLFIGLKVLVGLSAVVIAFSQFKKLGDKSEDE